MQLGKHYRKNSYKTRMAKINETLRFKSDDEDAKEAKINLIYKSKSRK